ncbi:MAG TPA: formate dehydrogenase subunit gamma [Burkholderiaceae bacterium]|jgi:formate dehydrogenase subunit gamma|nr:formate dehydrogenase subunit gamma [Burkholderiaceae bacterium]
MHPSLSWQRILPGLLFALLLLPASTHAAVPNKDAVPAYAEEQTILQTEKDVPEPGWTSPDSGRRHFDRHFIVPFGTQPEQDVILQRGGNTWRTLRNGPIATASGTLLLVVPLLMLGFYRLVGPARLDHPESGRKIERFSDWERTVHWATAISFLLLAATGLILMFGKKILLPWMGHMPYSWLAAISVYIHNFVGPLFILCSIIMFATFAYRNIFQRWDWLWIKKVGGLITHEHVPAGFFNAGEKLWFWGGVTLLGLLMSVTGLVLDFVNLGQTRYILQWANYLHITGATLYMVAAMGHIYIGTLGTPGAYEAMRYGTVDEEWAKEHHELWYNEVRAGAAPATPPPRGAEPRPGI